MLSQCPLSDHPVTWVYRYLGTDQTTRKELAQVANCLMELKFEFGQWNLKPVLLKIKLYCLLLGSYVSTKLKTSFYYENLKVQYK